MDDFLGSLAIAAIFNKAFAVIFFIVLLVLGVGFVGMMIGQSAVYDEGIERGFAEYCSTTGQRRWVGECDE